MANLSTCDLPLTIGVDLSDRYSHYCIVGPDRNVLRRSRIFTRISSFEKFFQNYEGARVVFEVGPHSRWVQQVLAELDLEVIVADPRRLDLISRSKTKTDRHDAEILARLGQVAVELLHQVKHRSEAAQLDLALLKSREALVSERTRLVNRIRGIVKATGPRLPKCGAEYFFHRAARHIPEGLRPACQPLLDILANIHQQLLKLKRQIKALATKKYPEAQKLTAVNGVGDLTALTFVLTVDDPRRFRKSRELGAYFGLVPRKKDSGMALPQLGITKTGNPHLRKLLVNCAQYILGPFGKDCYLRRWGLSLCARGGKNAKKRAVVALARRLACLLHRLWTTEEPYDPCRNLKDGDMKAA